MKKLFAIILSAMLILTMCTVTAFAIDQSVDLDEAVGRLEITEDGTYILTGTLAVQLSELCAAVIGYSSDETFALLDGTDIESILVTKDEQVLTTQGLSQKQQIAA